MKSYCQSVRAFAACLFTITVTSAVSAQGLNSAQQIIDFSTAKSPDYKTWSADYTHTMSMMGSQVNATGEMIHKEPGKMWMRVNIPMMGQQMKMTMIAGADRILWQVMDMGPQQQITKIDMNRIASNVTAQSGSRFDPLAQMDPSRQWVASREMFDFTVAKPQEIEGQPMYVMEGHWKKAALTNAQMAVVAAMVDSSRVFIGQKDGFLHRLEQFDKSGTNLVMALEFNNLKFNEPVPDSKFLYQPPPNVQVMDMTPMVEMQMRGRMAAPALKPAMTNSPTPSKAKPPMP